MNPQRLETERLILRSRTIGDFPAYAAMWADPETTRYIGGAPLGREEAWTKFARMEGLWALNGRGFFALEDKATGRFVGEAGCADFKRALEPPATDGPEFGWSISRDARGRGYASEAVEAALGWAETRFAGARASCLIDIANLASIRVAEKCGFRLARRAGYKGDTVLVYERVLG